MGFLNRHLAPKREIKNHFNATKSDRTVEDWLVGKQTADATLKWSLGTMRDRSRDLADNSDHAKNFFRKLKTNVVGPTGFKLQVKGKQKNGKIDKPNNALVEKSFTRWSLPENASVCGTMSLREQCELIVESTAKDGDNLIRIHRNFKDNPFKFALQIIEADHLDEKLNRDLPNGNKIRLGIEKNPLGRPVAYYLFKNHPGDIGSVVDQKYVIVPAEDIIHPFTKLRASQSRGIPWMHTAIIRLRQLGAFEEAAVINARIGASQMGLLLMEEAEEFEGDEETENGDQIINVEPGLLRSVSGVKDFKEFNSQYPNGEFATFSKAMLRGVASGIGCSYNSLANDLEGVSFSSLRQGALDERDSWKVIQAWFAEKVLNRIYAEWIVMAVMSGQLKLSFSDIDRFSNPKWQARRWDWVDPLKDIQARKEELSIKTTSPQRICAEKGVDFEDIIEEWKEAEELLAGTGLTIETANSSTTEDLLEKQELDEKEEEENKDE